MKTKNDIIYYIINYIYYIKQIQLKILNNKILKKYEYYDKIGLLWYGSVSSL